MATVQSGVTTINSHFQAYYSKKMLPHAVQKTILAQYGQKTPYPRDSGALTMKWMRPSPAAINASGLVSEISTTTIGSAISEGVPITTFRDQVWNYVTATLAQYVEASKISDIMTWASLYDAAEIATMLMGEDVALHMDALIRNELVGALTTAGGNKRYSPVGGTQTYAALRALAPSACTFTIDDLLDGMTYLTNQRAPKINGEYVTVVPPAINRDILKDAKVVLTGQYGNDKGLQSGTTARWYGNRVEVATNPFIEDASNASGEGTYANPALSGAANTGNIYRTFILGSDGFGIPLLSSGGMSPFGPKVIICDKADKSDPANQFVTISLKTWWTVKTLNPVWMVSISSKSTFAP